MTKLPVSIIAPVRNCIDELPDHAAHLLNLSAVVEEVIVVDSESKDGTAEYLVKHLRKGNIRLHDHPPGLYQSWNHGISLATQPYCSVATVGDILPPDSLELLLETMIATEADVVLSAPTYLDAKRRPMDKRWPLHELIEICGIEAPSVIDPMDWILLTTIFFPGSLMGSSASNLYRTRFIQAHPLPVDYGHAGDSVWGFQHSLNVHWAVDPRVISYFWLHEEANHKQRKDSDNVMKLGKFADQALEEFAPYLKGRGVPSSLLDELRPLAGRVADLSVLKIRRAELRKWYLPDLLQPELRKIRNARKDQSVGPVREKVKSYLRQLRHASPVPSIAEP